MKLDLSTSAAKRRPERISARVKNSAVAEGMREDGEAPEGPEESIRAGGLMQPSVSLLMSVLIHCALVVLAGWLTLGQQAEVAALPGEVVEIGVLPSERLDPNQFSADQLDESQPDSASDADLAMPDDPFVEVDQLDAMTPSSSLFGAGGDGGLAAGGLSGGGSGAGGQASFMGVQAYGRRFCIIADRSGSMKGQPLAHVKEEIRSTLRTMTLRSYVHLVFYSTSWHAFPESWAKPREIQDDADLWLRDLHSGGGTNPAPAFNHAFSLEPPPDAIFFMTDGRIPPNMHAHVSRLNSTRSKKIKVHTIAFLNRAAGALLERIADESGGKFRYVEGF